MMLTNTSFNVLRLALYALVHVMKHIQEERDQIVNINPAAIDLWDLQLIGKWRAKNLSHYPATTPSSLMANFKTGTQTVNIFITETIERLMIITTHGILKVLQVTIIFTGNTLHIKLRRI